MRIRKFASACLVLATLCSPQISTAQVRSEPTLADISGWFNGIETLHAKFQQYNPDGSIDTGVLYIKRPGRMRMEYDSQDALLVVGGGSVALYDGINDQRADRYPLRSTPLWHILRRDVDLGRPGAIKAFNKYEDLTRITAYDSDAPESGRVVFEFANGDGTIKLDGWNIRNALGETVTVRLREPEYGIPLSELLFSIRAENKKRETPER